MSKHIKNKKIFCLDCKKEWFTRSDAAKIFKGYCNSCSRKRSKASEETKRKMSLSHIGNPGSKGLKHTEETKRKIREANIGNKWNLGKHLPAETLKRMSESHKGNKSHLWKGGLTSKNSLIRSSLEYKLWQKACLIRDNYTCQKTGQIGGKLEVHHINNFADFPELRTSIENGITLSKKSHKEFHKIYGKKNNTKEQLLIFLNKK